MHLFGISHKSHLYLVISALSNVMKPELQKAMLVGMFLSKYDQKALDILGFESFTEAFNVLGLSLGVKPNSIRNYRDEFDPIFPNHRQGWHKRPMYSSRKEIVAQYNQFSLDEFSQLIKTNIYKNPELELLDEAIELEEDLQNTFAKRLITGQAAEQYFVEHFKSVDIFAKASIEDTTRLGCGFDFKLNFKNLFYAVEVKGLNQNSGTIGVTEKEYRVANTLKENYFIFLVKNFIDKPTHQVFCNPFFHSELNFSKQERSIIQVNWSSKV